MIDCSMDHPQAYTLGDSIHKQTLKLESNRGMGYSSTSECGCGGNCNCGKKVTPLS